MDPSALVADRGGYDVDEGGDVVAGDALALEDFRHGERGPFPAGPRVGVRDHPELGPRLDRQELDLEPVGQARVVRPDRGDLRHLVPRDHSFRPSARSSLNFHSFACISSSTTPRIWTARIAAFTAASTPTVAIGTPVGICAVIASASFPTICGAVAIGTPITGSTVRAATAAARWPDNPVEHTITLSPRSNAVRAYSSTRSGFLDEDMIRTSCGTSNFSRIRPASRRIGSSAGEAARTPTSGAGSIGSVMRRPPATRAPRCRYGTACLRSGSATRRGRRAPGPRKGCCPAPS